MIKDRQPDWGDTNMSLFGSDVEKKCKEAAADGEVQWEGQGEAPGLQVWRIEAFKVKPWPKSKYGRFHIGDSYICLNTYLKDPENNPKALAWDIHFWIGAESTQDEYGTAAYKTVELSAATSYGHGVLPSTFLIWAWRPPERLLHAPGRAGHEARRRARAAPRGAGPRERALHQASRATLLTPSLVPA